MSDSERNLLKEKQSRIVNRVRCNVRRMPMLNRHLPMLNMHIAVIPIVTGPTRNINKKIE